MQKIINEKITIIFIISAFYINYKTELCDLLNLSSITSKFYYYLT